MQGSGLSDGSWVTLGAHEVDDLETVVSHLRETYPESAIGLWGRSMGAVTALMYSQRDPSIAGVVSCLHAPERDWTDQRRDINNAVVLMCVNSS